jgi:hypothetical protein
MLLVSFGPFEITASVPAPTLKSGNVTDSERGLFLPILSEPSNGLPSTILLRCIRACCAHNAVRSSDRFVHVHAPC